MCQVRLERNKVFVRSGKVMVDGFGLCWVG